MKLFGCEQKKAAHENVNRILRCISLTAMVYHWVDVVLGFIPICSPAGLAVCISVIDSNSATVTSG